MTSLLGDSPDQNTSHVRKLLRDGGKIKPTLLSHDRLSFVLKVCGETTMVVISKKRKKNKTNSSSTLMYVLLISTSKFRRYYTEEKHIWSLLYVVEETTSLKL